ncbi:hypothetical protein MMC07_005832 [Pseudocyphellaria aurata]|nr:hypothetical protein [Pseudocyphellaria aurata]
MSHRLFSPLVTSRKRKRSEKDSDDDADTESYSTEKARPDLQDGPLGNGQPMLFRQQHLAALTAILHKCMLEGDYIRAGRTWGILLRTEVGKKGFINPRTTGRWGFGAEILYHRPLQPIEGTSRRQTSSNSAEGSKLHTSLESKQWFSSEGFEKARDYYERLILQHPYRVQNPSAVSAMNFYPAMFGLWIYSVQEQYELSLKTLPEAEINLAQGSRKSEHTGESDFSSRPQTPVHSKEEHRINLAYLRRAQEIAARLDEILVSPPFSDSAGLLDLRGMVNRWTEDLSITTSTPGPKSEFRPEEGESSTIRSN